MKYHCPNCRNDFNLPKFNVLIVDSKIFTKTNNI